MKLIKVERSCRYADPVGPHMPQIDFVEGTEVEVSDALAESVIRNKDGHEVHRDQRETKVVEPESKDEGVVVESKDAKPEELPGKKPNKRKRGPNKRKPGPK